MLLLRQQKSLHCMKFFRYYQYFETIKCEYLRVYLIDVYY